MALGLIWAQGSKKIKSLCYILIHVFITFCNSVLQVLQQASYGVQCCQTCEPPVVFSFVSTLDKNQISDPCFPKYWDSPHLSHVGLLVRIQVMFGCIPYSPVIGCFRINEAWCRHNTCSKALGLCDLGPVVGDLLPF